MADLENEKNQLLAIENYNRGLLIEMEKSK